MKYDNLTFPLTPKAAVSKGHIHQILCNGVNHVPNFILLVKVLEENSPTPTDDRKMFYPSIS